MGIQANDKEDTMDIITFEDALEFYGMCKMMKDDLPDGQWEELREMVGEYMADYGRKPGEWPEDAKECFTEDVRENANWWL
jgi:hypothetical protein